MGMICGLDNTLPCKLPIGLIWGTVQPEVLIRTPQQSTTHGCVHAALSSPTGALCIIPTPNWIRSRATVLDRYVRDSHECGEFHPHVPGTLKIVAHPPTMPSKALALRSGVHDSSAIASVAAPGLSVERIPKGVWDKTRYHPDVLESI